MNVSPLFHSPGGSTHANVNTLFPVVYFIVCLLSFAGYGQDISDSYFSNRHDVGKFIFESDNDAYLGTGDAQYTNGLKVGWYFSPRTRRSTQRWARVFDNPGQNYWFFTIGHKIFTPSEIAPADWEQWLSEDFPRDRPYSGLAFGEIGYELHWDSEALPKPSFLPFGQRRLSPLNFLFPTLYLPYFDKSDSPPITRRQTTLLLGKAGKGSFAGPIQRNWHSLLRDISGNDIPPHPVGWDSTGVEIASAIAFNLEVTTERDIVNWSSGNNDSSNYPKRALWRYTKPGAKLSSATTVRIGSIYIDYQVGLNAQIGLLGALPLDGPNESLTGPRSNRPFVLGGGNSSAALYFFGGFSARFSAYNRHIDNGLFNDSRPNAKRELLVFEARSGIVLRQRPLEFRFILIHRTLETESSPFDGSWHRFGQLTVSFLY